ncbi:MAG: MBL fold metallo-hydrolase [Sphingomonadaceae bacterium]|nr:MBL fold metallo-hydrolase [Sphingomonadaceae bacterium]
MAAFAIGDAMIDSALELEMPGIPITALGANGALVEAHRAWLAPHFLEPGDLWRLNFRSWIVKIGDKIVVVDPCTGNGRPNPIPLFDRLDIPFLERFEATGTRVEDVDYVFCTHMHYDHCGWNTMLRDGRWVPTFPNARYVFARRELDRWHPDRVARYRRVAYNDGVYERSIAPVVAAGLAELVLDGHAILPNLHVEPGPGHTHGHSMLRLVTGGAEAMFSGDAFHHPLQLIEPTLHFGDYDDGEAIVATRRRLVEESLTRDMLIIPAHLPHPHAGRMKRSAAGLRFEPA